MPKCLYCQEVKEADAFNREHVLPEAFGLFEENLVLKLVVCRACNTYFDKHLEIRLARDSIEGLARYEHGLKPPTAKTSFGRAALLRARVNDGGFYDGAQVWWGPSDDGTRLVLRPLPQFGVGDGSGKQVWFPIDELPLRSELEPHGFVRGVALTLKPFGIDPSVAEGILHEKGYAPSPFELVEGPHPGTIGVHISGVIDRRLMRAVAKIAFNYLAYHYEGIARMAQFDAIRRYIRYDHLSPSSPVSLSSGEFLAGLPPDRAPLAHAVGVSWNQGRVVGQVTLFFRFHYRIVLADGGFLFAPATIGKGHLFNPVAQQTIELTPDPRRGRPIQVPPPGAEG